MNLSEIDMQKEFAEYQKLMPVKKLNISGRIFKYRYYKNPEAKATLVILAGGSGMADGFFIMAKKFIQSYSLLIFNYPMDFKNNNQTADAIAQLIKYLKAKNIYCWGQSYGGIIAQILAKRHPEAVQGLILTSTASLSNDLSFEGMECFVNMLNEKKEQKRCQLYQSFPMPLLPAMMNLAFKKYLKDTPDAYEAVKTLMQCLKADMTKEYFCHMTSLLGDIRNHIGTHDKKDFAFLKQHVLIIEPDDDKTFTQDIKNALINIMPEPEVICKPQGGHLGLLFHPDEFIQIISDFINSR